ncbi:hypothetical protein E4U43_007286 [Claviceps pusilla]|uniref:Uncharacterized protein n=1 Tax=Claviceps pusilla TaxID=123648 RepID=A0A9P7SY75_9HYPO|nr:hypothetical protein E4U43_007286 [Claviceps pusilla]
MNNYLEQYLEQLATCSCSSDPFPFVDEQQIRVHTYIHIHRPVKLVVNKQTLFLAPIATKAPTARRTPSAPPVKLKRTLKTVRWARADAYKSNPEKRRMLEKTVSKFMENREDELRRLNVVEAVIK